ncbi:MAG: LytTR family DNA-binding domain-containing protein [Lachnospiraceae bacterium]|nr:LytTR family DNA-binding domain-containing protein [Lachnospiraceae bacterium]
MINIYLCDDNKMFIGYFRKELEQILKKLQLDYVIDCFYSGESLINELSDNLPLSAYKLSPDFVFMDVLMNEINGIEAAQQLRSLNCTAEIVFLSSTKDFVFSSFDVQPLNYLIKNEYTKDQLSSIFFKTNHSTTIEPEHCLHLTVGSKLMSLPYRTILYFEVCRHKVTFHTVNHDSYSLSGNLKDFSEEFRVQNFVQIYQSYMVNLAFIKMLTPRAVLLHEDISLPLGRTYSADVKSAYLEYITQ